MRLALPNEKTKNKTIIELKDVWKTYKVGSVKVNALAGITLTIKKGEFISIMGPSGSGKSTTMNMIGCLDIPTRGTIRLKGKDISKMTESELAQIRGKTIGFIFQQFNLIRTLTAKENIILPMIFQNIPSKTRNKKAEELLRMVGLKERANHKPTELSGGQQQRVAIARALANETEVILADEPTGNLDSKTGEAVMNFLDELHKKKGTTIILVTHDAEVARHAEKIIHIRDGKIINEEKNTNRKKISRENKLSEMIQD